MLDGELFALGVTDDLYTALRYLRNIERIRTLWIDAICIDQETIGERNAQVAGMAEGHYLARHSH